MKDVFETIVLAVDEEDKDVAPGAKGENKTQERALWRKVSGLATKPWVECECERQRFSVCEKGQRQGKGGTWIRSC